MRLLVIGAAGNIGSYLCEKLTRDGHEVFGVCRPGSLVAEGTVKIEMDLCNLDEGKLPNVDAVFYMAQSRFFRDFPDQWKDIFQINITIPLKIADWARRTGVSGFHFASSGGVYEGGVVAVRESAEINANRDTGFYVGSRLSAEVLLRNFAQYFEVFSIVRPFFVYGPNQSRGMLIPRLVDNIKDGKEIILNGHDGIKINPIHVHDAAIAFSNLLKLRGFHAMNIAGSEVLTLKQLSWIIAELIDKKPLFKVSDIPCGDLIGDTELMFRLLHVPETKIKKGVLDLIK